MNQQHSTVNLTLARVTQATFASSAVWPKISANAAEIQETNIAQLHIAQLGAYSHAQETLI